MKRLFLATITLATIGSPLFASGIIDCSGTAGAINTCVASKLPNFQTQLDWAILGQPVNGTIYNGLWTANNVLPSGMDVTVSSTNIAGGEGLRLAYNLGTVFYAGDWTNTTAPIPGVGYTHPGHFLATSDPSAPLATIQADPTIHLMGLALNGVSSNRQLLIDFSSGFSTLGFYGAAQNDANFGLTVQIFSGAGGTGLLSSQTFNYTGPGGTCSTMTSAPIAPTGCNDAPFFYASGFNDLARSVLISTTDDRGFYISNLYIGEASAIPEPGPMILCGCGIALMAIGSRRKWLRKKAR